MDYHSDDYFTYKRSKLQNIPPVRQKGRISKISFLFQLFIATFIIMFILIVLSIMKYSAKVDIEYSANALSQSESSSDNLQEGEKIKIDKRLILIQQEENAPNEAKIIADFKENSEVIDPQLVEENKKIDKTHIKEFKEKQQEKLKQKMLAQEEENQKSQAQKPIIQDIVDEIRAIPKQETLKPPIPEIDVNSNITIMSKVLIGRYPTLEEAQAQQSKIKAQNPSMTPYVKKVGNVFAIQMGSYQDFNIAKRNAQVLQSKGYDVWIYQQ